MSSTFKLQPSGLPSRISNIINYKGFSDWKSLQPVDYANNCAPPPPPPPLNTELVTE